jgi:ABC-type antimicrobial peptide transport system permease subunit
LCSDAPTSRRSITCSFSFDGKQEDFGLSIRKADTDYFRTFQIPLVAGRVPFGGDSVKEYILNEAAVRKLGFSDMHAVVGKMIDMDAHAPVVGVVRDFSSGTPMSQTPPLVLSSGINGYQYIAVHFDPAEMQAVMRKVKSAWEGVFPEYAYEQHFMDETVAQYFTMLNAVGTLLKAFATIALLVSCLGLYGLVAFMVSQKTKEVSIRKVLGASVQNILVLFSREFTLLVGVAFVVAAPVGYFLAHTMLQGFGNRIDIGWGVFALVLAAALLVAWLTVGYRALRAALADPAKNLRTE